MSTPRLALAAALVLCAPGFAEAQTVSINFNQDAKTILGNELQVAEGELENLLTEEFQALYSVLNVEDFLRLSANAQSMANKGLGADYASNPDFFIFGIAANFSADAGDTDINDPTKDLDRGIPVSAGAQISAMVGLNLSKIGLSWLTIFVNGLYFPLKVNQLEGTFFNLGAHAQVRLFGFDAKVIEWGGLALTSGIQRSQLTMSLNEPNQFEASAELAQGVSLDTVTTGNLKLVQSAMTVPVELTTNITILKFVTVFAGAAVDFPFGDATADYELQSELSTTINGENLDVGDATITVTDQNKADRPLFRLLGGVQLNLWIVNLFAQLNFTTRDLALGVAAGLRVEL